MNLKLIIILLVLNYIKSDAASLTITQNGISLTVTGSRIYNQTSFTFLINNQIYKDQSIFTSKSENQLVLELPPNYCGNVTLTTNAGNSSSTGTINLKPVFYQTEYPFTNNGSSLGITYYYSNCYLKMKTINNTSVDGGKISSCTVNSNSSVIRCQISPGSGYKNFTADINGDGSLDLADFKFRYGGAVILDQNVTFNQKDNTTGTVTYYGFNFANTNDCKINFIKANVTLPCTTNSSNSLTFVVEGSNGNVKNTLASLRGLITITIDGISIKGYYIVCKIIGFDQKASRLLTNGGYMIYKGQNFREAEDLTKGSEPLSKVIQARFVNPLYRYICNLTITGANYDTLNISIPNGIGNGTLFLYYDTYYVMQTPISYDEIYTPSNDSNRMTVNIIYTVIIVLGFLTILFFIIHSFAPIGQKIKKLLGKNKEDQN